MRYFLAFVLAISASLPIQAAALSCESSPETAAASRDLDQKLQTATFEESLALKQQAYRHMMQMDPSDYRPIREYLSLVRYDMPERWDAVRSQFVDKARTHPEDPVNLVAGGIALLGTDTPQSFAFLNQAIKNNPDYAAADLELAAYYDHLGKFTDKTKAESYLEEFYSLCPASMDPWARRYLKRLGSNELKTQAAGKLRERLASSADPELLTAYSDIWSLEFSVLPITELARERERVAEDLSRLQKPPIKPTAEWLEFLKDGYKQSGASDAQIEALDTRIKNEFPQSDQAFEIWSEKWNDQHPRPSAEATAADWQQYMKLAEAHYAELPKLFPNRHGFSDYYQLEYASHINGTPDDEIVRLGEGYIKESDTYNGPSSQTGEMVARVFLEHNLEPARALQLVQEARRLRTSPREMAFFEIADYAKPKTVQDSIQQKALQDAAFNVVYLEACRAAGDQSAAAQLKATVESAPPTDAKVLPAYWNARALLAEIEGHNMDALAFYQKAIFLREPPRKQYGVLDDRLIADARRVWSKSQGSDMAFAIWSQPDNVKLSGLAESRWEKPDKELPTFELADLQGKTWKLQTLEGKKVLINVWATWCGPCQAELPHLQKLYEQIKDRPDVAIISLNFDEDVGMVEPFVKKKGYTFPVLPAYTLLSNKVDVNSIPRNWLVDAKGKWQWEQIGYDSTDSDWEKNMLTRLEGVK